MNIEVLERASSSLMSIPSVIEGLRSVVDRPEQMLGWVVLVGAPLTVVATCFYMLQLYRVTESNISPAQQVSLDPPNYHPIDAYIEESMN